MQDSKDSTPVAETRRSGSHALPWMILAAASMLLAVLQIWAGRSIRIWMPLEGYLFGDGVAHSFHALMFLICAFHLVFGWLAQSRRQAYTKLLALSGATLALIHGLYAYYLVLPHLILASGAVPYRLPEKAQSASNASRVVELISILPYEERGKRTETTGTFRQYRVLGRLDIADESKAQELKKQVFEDMASASRTPGLCFFPRHALVLDGPAGKIDVIICYECQRAEVFVRGKRHQVGMSSHSKPFLNSLLQEAGIPLAPETHEP